MWTGARLGVRASCTGLIAKQAACSFLPRPRKPTHSLKRLFKTGKVYHAFTYGVPKEREGRIEFAIGRSRKDFRLRSAQPRARGTMREAITDYKVLDDIGTHALIELRPKTGRTHQIRVHLKAIHHPIVCDPLYAPKKPCDLGIPRLALHAQSLTFPLPDGSRHTVTAGVPEDLKAAYSKFPGLESGE